MYPLSGTVQHYAWGTTDVIPKLLNLEVTGEPHAEYWLGAHPSSPSLAFGQPLDKLIREEPALLGQKSVEKFGAKLPYLVKILSAAKALSLQAHPSRAQAEEGFAAETKAGIPLDSPVRIYRDDWPKPEMMIALEPFDALCGFRDPLATYQLFHGLDISGDLDLVIGPLLLRGGQAGLAEVFLDCLTMEDSRKNLVSQVLAAAMHHVDEETELGEFCRTAVLLDGQYPANPAILAALLMNRVQLQAGEAIFLRAGLMHAYLHGTGVEVMANSDNVIRGGLTSKHISVDELIKVVDFSPEPVEVITPTETSQGLFTFPNCTEEFSVCRITPAENTEVALPHSDCGRIVLVIDGEIELASDSNTMKLVRGESTFLTAGEQVVARGTGDAVVTQPGI